jgi:hypothetical protein
VQAYNLDGMAQLEYGCAYGATILTGTRNRMRIPSKVADDRMELEPVCGHSAKIPANASVRMRILCPGHVCAYSPRIPVDASAPHTITSVAIDQVDGPVGAYLERSPSDDRLSIATNAVAIDYVVEGAHTAASRSRRLGMTVQATQHLNNIN